MQCHEVKELLSPYLDGVLNSAKRESIYAHLAVCPGCRAELHALGEVVSILKALPAVDPPAGFTAGVRMSIIQLRATENPAGAGQIDERGGQAVLFSRGAAPPPAKGTTVSFLKNLTFGKWSLTAALAATLVLTAGVTTMVYGLPSQWGAKGLLQRVVFSESKSGFNVTLQDDNEKPRRDLLKVKAPHTDGLPQPGTPQGREDTVQEQNAQPPGQLPSAPQEQEPGEAKAGPPAGRQQPEALPAAKVLENDESRQHAPKTFNVLRNEKDSAVPLQSAALSVAAADFSWFSGKAADIARASGGFVLPDGKEPEEMTIRVPAGRLDEVVGLLRELGQVQFEGAAVNGGGSFTDGKSSDAPQNQARQGIEADVSAGEVEFAIITIRAR